METGPAPLILAFLRWFFRLLYHSFAWTYDLVAAIVSVGLWFHWIETIHPHLDEAPVLELGFGTGHLQEQLAGRGRPIFGLDESPQMTSITRRRLIRKGSQVRLVRALAQNAPFPSATFRRVVATFPSEFIFDPKTLAEVNRLLKPGGQFIVLPAAWITSNLLPHRLARALFRVTHEAPPRESLSSDQPSEFEKRLLSAGFAVEKEFIPVRYSEVLLIISTKLPQSK